MSLDWEFDTLQDSNYLTAGTPDIVDVKNSRKKIAEYTIKSLDIKRGSTLLDLGSGPGLVAKELADLENVDHIYCYDISNSFLMQASGICKNKPNVSFHKIMSGRFFITANNSIDIVYSHAVFIHLNI